MTRSKLRTSLLAGLGLGAAITFGSTALYSAADSGYPDVSTSNDVDKTTNESQKISPEQAQQAVASAKSLSTAFRVAADRVSPSVVMIESKSRAASTDQVRKLARPQDGQNPFKGTPFEDLFDNNGPMGHGFRFEQTPERSVPRTGIGSGVVISTSGLVMTNNHVVAGGKDVQVTVRLADGREFSAIDVWTDPKTDIAIVKIRADGLVPAKLGNSDDVSVGDWVLALGQPFGLEGTVTAGIVARHIGELALPIARTFCKLMLPLIPAIVVDRWLTWTAKLSVSTQPSSSRSGGSDGIGFAVPINMANWVGKQLADGGMVQRAYLGVGIQPVTAAMAGKFNVRPREGVVVTEVRPNTPASRAGLRTGDVITDFAGTRISNPRELQLAVEQAAVGKTHNIAIVRDGKRMTINFVPDAQPDDYGTVSNSNSTSQSGVEKSSNLKEWGLELSDLNPAVAKQLSLDGTQGVVVTDVREDSPAAEAGLESGMVITQVNRQPVTSTQQFEELVKVADSSDGVLLLVKTKAGSSFLVLKK
ncbi:MAG: PDZ domain-containing protein [Pirellulales bacterium]